MSTTEKLKKLRDLMQNTRYVLKPIQAYIVDTRDAHGSEYRADCDKRREFISGFTGSEGLVIVTNTKALLWTDGRYFIQAEKELDQNWSLMKMREPGVLTPIEWLTKNIPKGSSIGSDPTFINCSFWRDLDSAAKKENIELTVIEKNLIDAIWPNKAEMPENPIVPLHLCYTGKSAGSKLDDIRKDMELRKAKLLVLSNLDEIAWTLNLRGSDIEYNPLFFSYIIIQMNSLKIYLSKKGFTCEVRCHLDNEIGHHKYTIESYHEFYNALENDVKNVNGNIWISYSANFYLYSILPAASLIMDSTPAEMLKVVKNKTEIEGMKNAHKKDSLAIISYLAWLDTNLGKCKAITEASGAEVLLNFRMQQKDFVQASFSTISAVGAHAALPHYSTSMSTDVPITRNEVYLCDSGGQYLDGTTDITRTWHFGIPTDYEKLCNTLVIKGSIAVETCVFPAGTKGSAIDVLARQYLWRYGLNFNHSTGHGVGCYLNVHEGPLQITQNDGQKPLQLGVFLSDEPGYYEQGKFGFRHEDVMVVITSNTPNNFGGQGYCTFEKVSLIPIQKNLLTQDLLTDTEVSYINNYHKKCRDILGPLMDEQGRKETKKWLWKETEPIETHNIK